MAAHMMPSRPAARHGLAMLVAGIVPLQAQAFPFELDDDIRGAWNTTIAIGAAMRATNPDPALIGRANGLQYPGARGASTGADDGTLNYRKGDVISAPVTFLSDLEVRYRNDLGAFARVRGWYDIQANHHGVPHGSGPNGYVPGAKLDDSGYFSANKFDGLQLLDAFVYGNLDVGESRVAARLGQQSINWGESRLYTGINAFNPLNFAALGRPGGRAEEALVPVNRAWASIATREGLNVEAFYALDWERSTLPACGTYGNSVSDSGFDPGCNFGTITPLPDRVSYRLGATLPRNDGAQAGKGGQYGIAARYFVQPLMTEFGAYYVNFNATTPIYGVRPRSQSPVGLGYGFTYGSDIDGMAISAVTGYRNVSMSAELSQFRNLPVQRNVPTMFEAASGAGPYAARMAALPDGALFDGVFRANKTQLLLGGTVDLSPVVALVDASVTFETSMQWATNLPSTDVERIGRGAPFGSAEYQGQCAGGDNLCTVDGFATRFAWGYRLVARASFPQPSIGLVVTPVIAFSQDVNGYAVDGSLIEGRWATGLGLRFVYQRFMFLDLGAAFQRHDTPYAVARDRSSYSVAAGIAF